MLTREKVIESIEQLPAKFSADEVIGHIILLEKIENGLSQSEKGQTTADEGLDKKLPEYL